MSQRGITRVDILSALHSRDIQTPYGDRGLRIYSKSGRKPIIVGIIEAKGKTYIQTVMEWDINDE